jgi:hypothetical protein
MLVHYKVDFWVGLLTTYILLLPIALYKNEKAVLILANLCSLLWTCILLTLLVTEDQASVINWFKAYSIADSNAFVIKVCLLWGVIAALFVYFFKEFFMCKRKN